MMDTEKRISELVKRINDNLHKAERLEKLSWIALYYIFIPAFSVTVISVLATIAIKLWR